MLRVARAWVCKACRPTCAEFSPLTEPAQLLHLALQRLLLRPRGLDLDLEAAGDVAHLLRGAGLQFAQLRPHRGEFRVAGALRGGELCLPSGDDGDLREKLPDHR